MEDKQIISFDLAKIKRGKERICKCKNPHYELDTVNRLVMCIDCGAVLEPFDALYSLAERMEQVEQLENRMVEKAQTYAKLADEEVERMIKNRVFRNMNEQYRNGMLPVCPRCNKIFEPTEINHWMNERFLEAEREDEKDE